MRVRRKSRLVAACAAALVVLAAVSWAALQKQAKVKACAQAEMEAKISNVLEEMYRDERPGAWNVTPEDGRLLRVLTEAIGAKQVVEIGTSHGYSAIWFCLALQTTGGRLITHEIDPDRVSLARENFKRAGVEHIVTLVEGDAHKTVTMLKGPIDILFLDADKAGNIDYLNKLLPLVRPGGLILAHNTTDLESLMQDYLEAVTTNPGLVTIFLHRGDFGIGVTLKKRQ
jgi:caffeoyl-CoA O-methyltransferase